jgi:hypothetical protein
VVEDVVEVVERLARLVARVQRPCHAVGGVEGFREATEELGHRQIRLAVAAMHGGIEDHRRAVG